MISVGKKLLDEEQMLSRIREIFDKEAMVILEEKNKDYAHGVATGSFRRSGEDLRYLGIDHYSVWAIYFAKHLDALKTWLCRRNVSSEPVRRRILDMINFLFMLLIMQEEDEVEQPPQFDLTVTGAAKELSDKYRGGPQNSNMCL